MIKAGLVGLGKMGISHCAILGAHPEIDMIAVCDTSSIVLSAFKKYSKYKTYTDYRKMINQNELDCLIVAAPTSYHKDIVFYALEKDLHVFCEKPLSLNLQDSREITEFAKSRNLVNQVGYHNRFIGTFIKTKKLLEMNIIGDIYHFIGESYGPVVIKPQGITWRSNKMTGGGCLLDYTTHVVDLINYFFDEPEKASGTILKKIYSKDVEDAVFSTFFFENGLTGNLQVNWSDNSFRKMSTRIVISGKKGKIVADAQECRLYLMEKSEVNGYEKGWNIFYITDQTEPVWYNLRGEEYSSQIAYFVNNIKNSGLNNPNSFESTLKTEKIIDLLLKDAEERN